MKRKLLPLLSFALLTIPVFGQDLHKSIDKAHNGEASCVAITNDGSQILTGGADNRAYLWDAKTGKKLKVLSHGSEVNAVAFNSSNSLFITAAGNKLIVFDAKEGKPKRMLKDHTTEVYAAAFSTVNERVASGSKGKNVRIWDGSKGTFLSFGKGHSKAINTIAYSADGQMIASGSSDNTIRVFDASNGASKFTIEADQKGVNAIAYSADGQYLASVGNNGTVKVWDANSGNLVTSLTDLKGEINAVTFSPDVQYIAAAGSENTVMVWDMESRTVKNQVSGHSKGITGIAFSEKGNVMVTVGKDGAMKIYDTKNLKIGKKKVVKDNDAPALTCSPVVINEDNANGILEKNEKPVIEFTVENRGKGKAYNVTAKLTLENYIKGISYDEEISIGNLDVNAEQKVSIPITIDESLETASGVFIVNITEGNGNDVSPVRVNFQSRGENQYNYIMVTEHFFTSGTGKAEIGAPITLHMKVKNIAQSEAKNIKVNFLFPDGVMAVDKLTANIETLGPEESKELSVQFYATESFTRPKLKMGLMIEGAAYTNAGDLVLAVTMNENLPGKEVHTEPNLAASDVIKYRGGGDPLKGLNVSKSKDMVIGKYYALIIGIDKYSGSWTPLNNAVSDAKGVESTLKSKYKFDVYKTLYNETATRGAIIKQLEWLVANVKPQDNVLIYYSGHGEYKQSLGKGYWVPVDAKTTSTSDYISNSDIQTYLAGIKSKHTLLISDACFSGDIFRGNTVSVPFEESEKYYKEVHNLDSRQAITSGGIEPVMDGGKNGHSVFAYYLLKVLQNNQNKYLDAGQLYTKIKIPVINNSEQTPRISPIKKTGDEGGQFIFIRK